MNIQVVVKIQNSKLRRYFSIYEIGVIVNNSIVSTVYKVPNPEFIDIYFKHCCTFFGVNNLLYIISY